MAYGGDVQSAVGVLEFKSHCGPTISGYGFGIGREDIDVFF